jgi:uncharacterized membrane protein
VKKLPKLFTKASTLFIILILLALLVFIFLAQKEDNLLKAEVLTADNSDVMNSGISSIGFQHLEVKLIEGKFKNQKFSASNNLTGRPSVDNFFESGDTILVSLNIQSGKVVNVIAVDKYRQNWELLLFLIFIVLLLIYAKEIGLQAIFSFLTSLLIIWKVLVAGLLANTNPILLALLVLILLAAFILFSIAGLTKKGLAAFIGTITGLFISVTIAMLFGSKMSLFGMTAPYAETLIFSGNLELNMQEIFYVAIFIGASGAAMDIAMDVAASMTEIHNKRPELKFVELMQSGFTVGRDVIGTMTTTLLLAYSGSYLPLLMLFVSKQTAISRILNYKVIAAEILRTITGSIGLVLTAPLTALIAAFLLTKEQRLIKNKQK